MSFKYAVTSDIHLGHRKTPTTHIANSFRTCILTQQNSDLDVLFIAGDLFDRLLDANSKEVLTSIELINHILNYCFHHGIKLRVLEGTPSHDWNQSQLVTKLNEMRGERQVDLKYFQVLDIEYMVEENKYILYIPDEWTHNHATIEKQIAEKLQSHGIAKVDLAILHGQCEYQVAGIPYQGFRYNETYFLNIVKGFIHIGHYHSYSEFDRIRANGSLERLGHGQEEDKGYVRVDGDNCVFHVNKNAFIYKTHRVTAKTTLVKLDDLIYRYPKEAYIRLQLPKDHPFNINFNELKLRYMDYNVDRLVKEEKEVTSVKDISLDVELIGYNLHAIDTDVKQLLRDSILPKNNFSPAELRYFESIIEVF